MNNNSHKKNLALFMFFLSVYNQNLPMGHVNSYLSPFAKIMTAGDNNFSQRKTVTTVKQHDGTIIKFYPSGIKEELFPNGTTLITHSLENKKQFFNPHTGVLQYQDKRLISLTLYTKNLRRQRSMSDASTARQEIFHPMNTGFGVFKNQLGEEIHTTIYQNGDYTEESNRLHKRIQDAGSFIKITTTNKESNKEQVDLVSKDEVQHRNPAYWAVLRYRLKTEGLYKKNMELQKDNRSHINNWL